MSFLEFSCFLYDPMDVGNLISGSSAISKSSLCIGKFLVHVVLKPCLKDGQQSWAKDAGVIPSPEKRFTHTHTHIHTHTLPPVEIDRVASCKWGDSSGKTWAVSQPPPLDLQQVLLIEIHPDEK